MDGQQCVFPFVAPLQSGLQLLPVSPSRTADTALRKKFPTRALLEQWMEEQTAKAFESKRKAARAPARSTTAATLGAPRARCWVRQAVLSSVRCAAPEASSPRGRSAATPAAAAAAAPSDSGADKAGSLPPVIRWALLIFTLICSFRIRLGAVWRYGRVIHEFDPWFNYRATE